MFGPAKRVGALDGDRVVDLNAAYAAYLRERQNEAHAVELAAAVVPSDLMAFIEGGQRALDESQKAIAYARAGGLGHSEAGHVVSYPASDVTLHAPHPRGGRIACAGGNYAAHSAGMAGSRGDEITAEKMREEIRKRGFWGFFKVNREIEGPDGDVLYPSRTHRLDYEGEAAIILGKRGKDVSVANARDLLWGVTLLTDWSIRDGHDTPRGASFSFSKNFDTSVSLGPCIVVGEVDPDKIEVQTVVSGDTRQHYTTDQMVYSYWEFLEFISRDFTLFPGDVLSGGTGSGTAMDSSGRNPDGTSPPEKFLKVGDVVEVSSPQIGLLRSHIVAKPGSPS